MSKLFWVHATIIAALASGLTSTANAAAPGNPATVETDLRRDATVAAVERVMPAVVNVGTESVVEQSRTPIDDLFREFFDPYHREREQDTTYSIGSGVIIDEEGHVLTNHHVSVMRIESP